MLLSPTICSKKLNTHSNKIGRRCQMSFFDIDLEGWGRKRIFALLHSNMVNLFQQECQKMWCGHFWFVFRSRWLFHVCRQWGITGNVSSSGFVRTTYFYLNEIMTCCHLAISCSPSMRHHKQCLFTACHTFSSANWESLFK